VTQDNDLRLEPGPLDPDSSALTMRQSYNGHISSAAWLEKLFFGVSALQSWISN